MFCAKGVDGVLYQVISRSWQTVYTYLSPSGRLRQRNWRRSDGTWVRMHDKLREWTRVDSDREPSPSEAIIDSQSVKSAAMVSHLAVSASVPSKWRTRRVTEEVGYDKGKNIKGRKRFLTVDTLGLVLRVLITAEARG